METRICKICGECKSIDEFWNLKRGPGGKDDICIDDRRKDKLRRAATPAGLYELRARILTAAVRDAYKIPHKAGYSLDHCFSIRTGFNAGVDLPTITNPNNLRLIPKTANLRKGESCSITRQQLEAEKIITNDAKRAAAMLEAVADVDKLLAISIMVNAYFRAKNEKTTVRE